MKRYPPYEPQEYLDWKPVRAVADEYRKRASTKEAKQALRELGRAGIERLYKGLVRSRLYDITLKRWVRTGVLTKAWLGQGEEAVTIGAVHALAADDPVGPMIRNAAACFEKGISLVDCLKVYLATGDTITQGRDLHIGDLAHNVVSPVSLVGDLVPVMGGCALAFRLRGEKRVALTWVGDGATRTAAFHEGMAVAAQAGAPLIVIVQDNGVALGTACSETLRASLRKLPEAYGVAGLECDGNHVLDVFCAVEGARERCLAGEGPVLIYARTLRMAGHATHDEREARALFPAEVFAEWGSRDPVACFEEFIAGSKGLVGSDARAQLSAWEDEVTAEIAAAEAEAIRSRAAHPPDPNRMERDVFA